MGDTKFIKYLTQKIFEKYDMLQKELGEPVPISGIDSSKIMELNHGSLHYVAQQFREKMWSQGIEYEDLVNVGVFGLRKAIMKYDVNNENNASFFSYSVHWIRREMIKLLKDNRSMIRIPYNIRESNH